MNGNDLVLRAPAPPPDRVLDLLVQHKVEIIALNLAAGEDWSAEAWRVFYDERAGLAEFDGG